MPYIVPDLLNVGSLRCTSWVDDDVDKTALRYKTCSWCAEDYIIYVTIDQGTRFMMEMFKLTVKLHPIHIL